MWFIYEVNELLWLDTCWQNWDAAVIPLAVGLLKVFRENPFLCCICVLFYLNCAAAMLFVIDALRTVAAHLISPRGTIKSNFELWWKISTAAFYALLYTTARRSWPFRGSEGWEASGCTLEEITEAQSVLITLHYSDNVYLRCVWGGTPIGSRHVWRTCGNRKNIVYCHSPQSKCEHCCELPRIINVEVGSLDFSHNWEDFMREKEVRG